MKFVVWIAYHLESRDIVDDYINRLQAYLKDHDFVVCEDLDSIKREIVDADAMIGWGITPEVFAEARNLKWIQFGSSGIDHTVFPELLHSDVIVTTMSGIHTVPVAEHVLAIMLALARRLDAAAMLQAEHSYNRAELAATSSELSGKTIGIIGLGKIGSNIARLAKAFDMRVVGTKRTVDSPIPNVDELFTPDQLHKILPVSDFLVLVVPLTSVTRALIGREEIALMKDGSYLINVARGVMVDHDALGDALRSGKLNGAALDVFPTEPLPPDSPIYDLPHTIITPHTAGSSARYSERAAEIFKRNLDAFVSGEEMINVYDKERGY
ncbi:MAG: D-2-hydroxyacid dehydrogenase [Armatimonadota bacterium]|nr:D-2-hydroxyacid dehydrogenase [bacterium]